MIHVLQATKADIDAALRCLEAWRDAELGRRFVYSHATTGDPRSDLILTLTWGYPEERTIRVSERDVTPDGETVVATMARAALDQVTRRTEGKRP